jgi:hypothetical protein
MKFFSAFVLKKSFTDVSSIKVDSVDEVDDHDRREEDRMIKNIFFVLLQTPHIKNAIDSVE